MASAHADRNLLYGLLALQMDFITRDDLIEAMQAWALDKGRPLERVLRDRGRIGDEDHDALEHMLRRHLARHGGDPEKSLAAVAVPPEVHDGLRSLADPEVTASLGRLATPTATPTPRDGRRPDPARPLGDPQLRRGGGRLARPLPGRPAARPGRARRGLRRARHRAEPRGRAEADPRPPRRRRGRPPPLRLRGRGHRRARAPGDRPGLLPRQRPRHRPALLRDAVHPGRLAPGRDRRLPRRGVAGRPVGPLARAPPAAGAADRRLQRRRLRPRPGRSAPRHQAVEHHGRQVRRDPGGRLGPGQGRRPARASRRRAPTSRPCGPRAAAAARRRCRARPSAPRSTCRPSRPTAGSTGSARPSDVYSLGATLYTVLVGRPPFPPGPSPDGPRRRPPRRLRPAPRRRPGGPPAPGGDLPEGDGPRPGRPLPRRPGRWPRTSSAGWPTSRSRPAPTRRWPASAAGPAATSPWSPGSPACCWRRPSAWPSARRAGRPTAGPRTRRRGTRELRAGRGQLPARPRGGRPLLHHGQRGHAAEPAAHGAAAPRAAGLGPRLLRAVRLPPRRRPEARPTWAVPWSACPASTRPLARCPTRSPTPSVPATCSPSWPRQHPEVTDYRSNLAASHISLGILYAGTGRSSEAEASYRRALELQERLAEQHPEVFRLPQRPCREPQQPGLLYADTGASSEAEASFCRALELRERLAEQHPEQIDDIVDLGGSYCNMGNLGRNPATPAGPCSGSNRAEATLRSVLDREPRHARPGCSSATLSWEGLGPGPPGPPRGGGRMSGGGPPSSTTGGSANVPYDRARSLGLAGDPAAAAEEAAALAGRGGLRPAPATTRPASSSLAAGAATAAARDRPGRPRGPPRPTASPSAPSPSWARPRRRLLRRPGPRRLDGRDADLDPIRDHPGFRVPPARPRLPGRPVRRRSDRYAAPRGRPAGRSTAASGRSAG